MKIVIDSTFNLHGGSEIHMIEFLKYFVNSNKYEKIIVYSNKSNTDAFLSSEFDSVEFIYPKLASISLLTRLLWQQSVLPVICFLRKPDVLFSPGNITSIISPKKTMSVVWIATVGPFCYHIYKLLNIKTRVRFYINGFMMKLSAKYANLVVHESKYSMQIFEAFSRKNNQVLIEAGKPIYEKFNKELLHISGDIIIVSHIYEYKNIETVLYAYCDAMKSLNSKLPNLQIYGDIRDKKYYKYLLDLVTELNLRSKVFFNGKVSSELLTSIYKKSRFMVYPSLCESSGYALIEAMSFGVPIIASNITAIPDTCSYGAQYFEPKDSSELSLLMQEYITNDDVIHNAVIKSKKRAYELPNYSEAAIELTSYLTQLCDKK